MSRCHYRHGGLPASHTAGRRIRPTSGLIPLPEQQVLPFGLVRWRLSAGGTSSVLGSRAW